MQTAEITFVLSNLCKLCLYSEIDSIFEISNEGKQSETFTNKSVEQKGGSVNWDY